MKVGINDSLPIAAAQADITAALTDHQVIVVAGETGSGKTTQLPKIAWQLGARSIAHTQPRRIAARSVARRIADECDVELGAEVGYAVRFDDMSGDDTQMRIMTDGLLLAEIHHDRLLRRYDTIIIDEAHERSLAIDFLLGYLSRILPRRPDLKVIVTSATIQVDRFAAMFDAPVIEVSGRTYPVEVRYRPVEHDTMRGVADAIDELPAHGDVLVFLSGEREIRDTAEYLAAKDWPGTEILTLYGRLSAQDQQRVFTPHTGRRIVVATNVAETSLTVPGIRYVVDAGYARISRYSQRLKIQRLPIEPISQASAAQRAGRCGRLADGICIRLYSEDDLLSRPEYTDPEIQRTNLASVLLQMALLDLGDISTFGFLDPPDSRAIKDGRALLTELGAWGRKGRLSATGRRLAQLPVDPRMGRMLIAADHAGCLADVLVVVSAMSIQDPRERPLDAEQQADAYHARFREPESDFLSYLGLWAYLREQRRARSHSSFRRMCRNEYLHYLRVREWQDVHAQLHRTVKQLGMRPGRRGADPDAIHRSLLSGLLSHLGLRDDDSREYSGSRGTRFKIFPGSDVAKKAPTWVMAAEIVETSRLWARTVARIDPSWAEKAGKHLVKRHYSEPHWSQRRGTAMAYERVTLYGLPLITDRPIAVSGYDTALARELFIRHGLVDGEWDGRHAFLKHNHAMLDEVEQLQHRVRRTDLRVDDDRLFEFYDARIPADIVSTRHFDAWWKKARHDTPALLNFEPEMLRAGNLPGDLDSQYPRQWRSQSESYDLDYVFSPGHSEDGVIVDIGIDQLMDVDERQFTWGIPARRAELVEALIRTLPKAMRKRLVPVPQTAAELAAGLDDSTVDMAVELSRQIRARHDVDVTPESFDMSAVPNDLKMTFRILDDGTELARGDSIAQLRRELQPHIRFGLEERARRHERHGLRSWDVGTLPESVQIGQATGYPALVDEGDAVGLVTMDSAREQHTAMIRAQSRLISFAMPSPVSRLKRDLDMRTALLLASGPYDDGAAVIHDSFLAAIDTLIVEHGGPVRAEHEFDRLYDSVRADAFQATERILNSVIAVFEKLSQLHPDDSPAGEDVRIQLSWLIYDGFIRDAQTNISRIALYLEAARRHLAGKSAPQLEAVQDLEARFFEATRHMSKWAQLDHHVQHVRWALEELRLSLFAQDLRTAFPVSIKRVGKLLDKLGLPEG